MSEAGAYVRQIPPLLELVVIKGVSLISLSLRWPSCSSYRSCLHLAEIKDNHKILYRAEFALVETKLLSL